MVGGLSVTSSSPTPSWKDWKFLVPGRLARVLSQDRREGEGGEQDDSAEGERESGSSLSQEEMGKAEEQQETQTGEEVEEGSNSDGPKKQTIVKLLKAFRPGKLIKAFSSEKKDSENKIKDVRIEGGDKSEGKKKEKGNLFKKFKSKGVTRSVSKQCVTAPGETIEHEGDGKIEVGGLSEQSGDVKIDQVLEGELDTADAQDKPQPKDKNRRHSVRSIKPGKISDPFSNVPRAEEKVDDVVESADDVIKEKQEEKVDDVVGSASDVIKEKGAEKAVAAGKWRLRSTRKARRRSKDRKGKERRGRGVEKGGGTDPEESREERSAPVQSVSAETDSE